MSLLLRIFFRGTISLFILTVIFFVAPYQASAYLLEASDMVGRIDHQAGTPLWTQTSQVALPPELTVGARAVEIDNSLHRLFVVDQQKNRVLVFLLDTNNHLPDLVPDYVLGQGSFFLSAAATTQEGMNSPSGVLYDPVEELLFVADTNNNRILVFNLLGGITDGMPATYVLGQMDFVTGTSGLTQATLNGPSGLMYDAINSYLFVSDANNNRILVFDLSGGIANGMPATYVLGQPDFVTGTSGLSQATLSGPSGLAYDQDNNRLFVADLNNSRIMVFDMTTIVDGEDAINVLGQPDFTTDTVGTTQSTLNEPNGLAYDAANQRLFIADQSNNRIMVFDVTAITDGEDAINVLGQPDFITSTSRVTTDGLNGVAGLYYDTQSGYVFAADIYNTRVMLFDVSAVTNGEVAVDILGQPNPDSIDHPNDALVDQVGHRLFVAESGANRVSVYNLNTDNTLIDRRADYVLGQPHLYRGIPGTSDALFNSPKNLAYDSDNKRLFVADNNNNRILVFDLSGGITDGMSASYILGQTDFTSNTDGTLSTALSNPRGMVYDSVEQLLLVTDSGNNRVLVFDLSGGIADGMPASHVLGQPDFVTGTNGTTQDTFDDPRDVAYNPTDKILFVSEYRNHRVLVFDLSGGITDGMPASYVLGQTDFTSVNPTVSKSVLGASYGVTLDTVNNLLFVADIGRSAIAVFDVAVLTNGEDMVNVLGQPDFSSTGTDVTQDTFYWPYGVFFDTTYRRLYVADEENSRVMVFDLPRLSTSTLPTGTEAVSYSATISGTGGTSPYYCSLLSGTLPTGLSLGSNCVISGTPTGSSEQIFSIRFSDSSITPPAATGFWTTGSYTLGITPNSSSTNRGGGGGLPREAFEPPENMSMLINDGAQTTNSRFVTLTLTAYLAKSQYNTTGYVAIAPTDDFSLVGLEMFEEKKMWDLCPGKRDCPPGTYAVYAKFYTGWGVSSSQPAVAYIDLVSDSLPMPLAPPKQADATAPPQPLFSRTLRFGLRGNDVLELQKLLNKQGFMLAQTGPGSPGQETVFFGRLTRAAVIRFQEANAEKILKPLGLSRGTGIVASLTIKCLLQLAEEGIMQ